MLFWYLFVYKFSFGLVSPHFLRRWEKTLCSLKKSHVSFSKKYSQDDIFFHLQRKKKLNYFMSRLLSSGGMPIGIYDYTFCYLTWMFFSVVQKPTKGCFCHQPQFCRRSHYHLSHAKQPHFLPTATSDNNAGVYLVSKLFSFSQSPHSSKPQVEKNKLLCAPQQPGSKLLWIFYHIFPVWEREKNLNFLILSHFHLFFLSQLVYTF